jgi:hypothetical protein
MAMKRFVIEREIPGVGASTEAQFCGIARASNGVLAQLAPRIQWEHSYVTADKLFCIYLAEDESDIRRHAEMGGFPVNRITEVVTIIDPITEQALSRAA